MAKLNWTPIIIVAIVMLSVLGIVYYAIPRQAPTNTVNAMGTAQITVPPDRLVVYVQVQTNASTATDAKDKNTEITNNVINALTNSGTSSSEIGTENYNIYQNCQYTQNGQVCSGFIASQNIKVTTMNLTNAGKIVDACVNNGALISYINFELSTNKQNDYKKTVLADAAKDAQEKAAALASGLGKSLGNLVSVSTTDYNYVPFPLFRATTEVASVAGAGAKQAVVNIQPTNLDVTATVSVVYEIR